MKWRSVAALVLLGALGFAAVRWRQASRARQPIGELQTFEGPTFSVRYPAAWEKERYKGPEDGNLFLLRGADPIAGSVEYFIEDGGDKPVEQFVRETRAEQLNPERLRSQTLAGFNGTVWENEGSEGTADWFKEFREHWFVFRAPNGRSYFLSYLMKWDRPGRLRQAYLFEEILGSMTFKRPKR